MRPTQGVSFPRSGHEIVHKVAKKYFGDTLVYCDVNYTRFCGCGSVPCVNPKRTFAKNHDFGLLRSPGVPITPTERYFIQYRNPVRSITSNFQLHLIQNPGDSNRAGWEKFAFREVFFWNRFIDKWVLDFPANADPPLYCTYEALLADPPTWIRKILAFLSDDPLDEDRIDEVLKQVPITPRDNLANFEFNDPVFFRELEDAASRRLAELDLPTFDQGV